MDFHTQKPDNLYFTSDHHFGHANIIKFCQRPFKNVHEMNKKLIEYWNNIVPPNGIVIHAGDFTMKRGRAEAFVKRLNGQIILVIGNHDKITKEEKKLFLEVCDLLTIRLPKGHLISVSHYAMRVWNKSHFNSWHVYGHSHGRLAPQGKSWDIGVDNNNYRPLSYQDLVAIMAKQPDNFNFKRK